MKLIYFIPILLSCLTGCNIKKNDTTQIVKTNKVVDSSIKKDSFFPVTTFIKGQMRLLDSLPVTPLHTQTINNKTDSEWIKKTLLKTLLASFLSPEIKETNLINFFKEISFNDQTLNAITFTYDPIKPLPDSIPLRHWDVYIDPESGKVTKVYLVKQLTQKDGNTIQQLTWKTDKYAKIVTLSNQSDGNSKVLKEDKFTWSFN